MMSFQVHQHKEPFVVSGHCETEKASQVSEKCLSGSPPEESDHGMPRTYGMSIFNREFLERKNLTENRLRHSPRLSKILDLSNNKFGK